MKIVDQTVKMLYPANSDDAVCALKRIEYAGRNCYQSHDKTTDESYGHFIMGLMKRKHDSPLEFADMMVEIVTGRDVLAEITRHRLASFAVQSQRYVLDNKSGEISFIKPLFYLQQQPLSTDAKRWCASRAWEQSMSEAEKQYMYLTHDCGMKPEDARKVLPNSTACRIVMKANIREWLHIMELRSSPAAYPEMRTMMNMLICEARQVYPVVFDEVGGEM